ncbi:ankyrin repeat domain-containing protein [Streptomyces sp. NBC_00445]|uniref:ankyrin repeat domain-containing protein n=1 Tax=Streptomyces sp. NBC_00445 TaxID=2975745 RepID=UPI002E203B73
MGGEETGSGRLVDAVRAKDADAVRESLAAGADPDTVGPDGLPVLCAAVAAYDAPVAEALVEAGADPDRALPDGTTPLERAVVGGSPAVFSAVLGTEPRLRLPEEARERLLALARRWYETGAAEELRGLTGARGPAETARVLDDDHDWVWEVTLGGRTVRAGHGSVLSALEWAFRILAPVDELIARAVREQDAAHVDWWAVRSVLAQRRSFETWTAVVAHRYHRSPLNRRFVLDYLRDRSFLRYHTNSAAYYDKKEGAFLADWAAAETDGEMLARVLDTYAQYSHPDQRAIGLRHAGHPDPRVRREVPWCLIDEDVALTAEAREALRALTLDPDAQVRLSACEACRYDEELAALLDDRVGEHTADS